MRRIISIMVLISAVSAFSPLLKAGGKKRAAVMDFTANNTSESYARIVRNQIEVSLYKTGKFEILERDKMDLLLKEQGMQASGCVDTSCAVEIGRLLSVDYVIVGSIDRLGKFLLTIKFIDVEKGIVTHADTDVAAKEDNIPDAINNLAARAAKMLSGTKVVAGGHQDEEKKKEKTRDKIPEAAKKVYNPYALPSFGFLGLGALSLGGGYYFNTKIAATNSDYDDLAARYSESTDVNEATSLGNEMSALEDDLNKYRLYRNISYGAGAVSILAAGYFMYRYFTYKPSSPGAVKSDSMTITPVIYSGFTAVNTLNYNNRYFFGGGIIIRF